MKRVSVAFNQSQWAAIERLVKERNCSIGAAVRLLVDTGIAYRAVMDSAASKGPVS